MNIFSFTLVAAICAIVVGVAFYYIRKYRERLSLKKLGLNVQPTKQSIQARIKSKLNAETVVKLAVFLFFTLYAIILMFPMFWGLICSLKSGGFGGEYWTNKFGFPKGKWHFENYLHALQNIQDGGLSYGGMFLNSIWFSLGSAVINMEMTAFFAYVLNKYTFRFRGFLYGIALFMVSVPIGASMVSTYRLMYDLHLTDSPLILLTAFNVYGMNLILFYSYWSNVSWTYAEAAKIDGAGFFVTYFKVMRVHVVPMALTLGIQLFITKWNDYMAPLLYMPNLPTLATGLFRYRSIAERRFNYPWLYAGFVVCMLPILIVFGIFSNRLLGKVSMGGGIKG